ncbi:DUF2971 domain-containing protein [Vibrio owensii]|nr:DUF2971 domain-containing protein [Vibrio owensii]
MVHSFFMSDYENASVWGHYGDNHTGVCLIYQSDDNDCISIKRPVSSSSNGECSFEYKPSNLAKITYSDSANRSIDFFNSLGILPAHKARKHWFSSHEGEISSLINNFDTSEWRSEYWKKFYRDITLKNEDWSYEKEHRLILTSMLFDFSTVEKRCLKYDFKQLKGVIFGVKTPIIDKVRIIKIIERLCEEHGVDSFEFYQASYNVQTNKILKLPLGIFNIPKKDRRL